MATSMFIVHLPICLLWLWSHLWTSKFFLWSSPLWPCSLLVQSTLARARCSISCHWRRQLPSMNLQDFSMIKYAAPTSGVNIMSKADATAPVTIPHNLVVRSLELHEDPSLHSPHRYMH
ncbi:hypothetical protein DE146DRAFT_415855 [Phaeosphaeria sp. MPI-PUGE-AT-0046c]|nr:hypothetical protein DE146DRAFT_415855 [Phaeosphaeria sp. MPI-PUGE-AT-0046c]